MHTITATHQHFGHKAHAIRPLHWLIQAFATRHQRMRLDDLDDHLLRDIGVDRVTAQSESHRSFWDLP